jgi:hypothetical protein
MPNSPIVLVMYRVGALATVIFLAACGGEPPASREHAPHPAVSAGPVQRLEPPLSDVAMLQLQPDGSYKRLCGAPAPQVRAMLEGVRRARRARR